MNRLVSMLSILLVVMPALDVIKYEGKSGYDKYVLTLPVNRRHIVQSHYLFYFLTVIYGALLSYAIFYIYGLVSNTPVDGILQIINFGTFIVLLTGAINYPLYYIFGPEKADSNAIGSVGGGIFVTFSTQGLIAYLSEQLVSSNLNIDPSLYVPIIYMLFGLIVYMISFFISVFIYLKKEF